MEAKVMLVDDHPLFLEGLKYLLETHGICVAGTARSGAEAIEKARAIRPDIILMDIRMPHVGGIDALRFIKGEMPQIKIIMLTTSEDDEDLFRAIRFGASGYLLKNVDAEELIGMLRKLERNEVPLSPGLAEKLLKEFKAADRTLKPCTAEGVYAAEGIRSAEGIRAEEDAADLNARQMEILELVARGVTYKEVGEKLGLSERTIKYHMGRILEQLHFENRAQLIAYAAQKGLIDEK